MGNPMRWMLRVPVPWVFILVYLAGYAVERGQRFSLPEVVLRWSWVVGMVVFGAGLVLAVWGQVLFRTARTTTVPGRVSKELVTGGPYRFTRNPMYVGLSFVYLGEAGMLRQVWPVIFFPLMWAYLNWTVIPLEEGKLTEAFPQEYPAYQRRVRRWI